MTTGPMLWGGRFAKQPDSRMIALTSSLQTDVRLLRHDAAATKAHARALLDAGLMDDADVAEIDGALDALVAEWDQGSLAARPEDEDVHSLVERELADRAGEAGRRIHAGRSRNDLVACDLRLWVKEEAATLAAGCGALVRSLTESATRHAEWVMPGYTHLQRAHPVTVGFHLVAHACALARDVARLQAAAAAADVSVLGAGALGTSTLELDARIAARELGLSTTFDNAMDAVADRDFACDLLYAVALCGVHLSRLAEDLVLWASREFGFVVLADDWSTGSSMLPHKRNPDPAELVRGRAASGIGDLTALLALLKGLPLAYDRDLQEDKEIVFRAADRLKGVLELARGMIDSVTFDRTRLQEASAGTWAITLAEVLVRRGVPFRDAHAATGRLVADVERHALDAPTPELLRAHHREWRDDDVALLSPQADVASRRAPGGPSPSAVVEQAKRIVSRVEEMLGGTT